MFLNLINKIRTQIPSILTQNILLKYPNLKYKHLINFKNQILNSIFNMNILSKRIINKYKNFKNKIIDINKFNNSHNRRNNFGNIKHILTFSLISIILMTKYKISNSERNNSGQFNKLFCYKATNKELEKLMSNLENQIKNLEFKYHGKMRRQPIK